MTTTNKKFRFPSGTLISAGNGFEIEELTGFAITSIKQLFARLQEMALEENALPGIKELATAFRQDANWSRNFTVDIVGKPSLVNTTMTVDNYASDDFPFEPVNTVNFTRSKTSNGSFEDLMKKLRTGQQVVASPLSEPSAPLVVKAIAKPIEEDNYDDDDDNYDPLDDDDNYDDDGNYIG